MMCVLLQETMTVDDSSMIFIILWYLYYHHLRYIISIYIIKSSIHWCCLSSFCSGKLFYIVTLVGFCVVSIQHSATQCNDCFCLCVL